MCHSGIVKSILILWSYLSKTDTLGPAISVRLRVMSVKHRKWRKARTNSRCSFSRGVRLIQVSVKRESTVVYFSFLISDSVTIPEITAELAEQLVNHYYVRTDECGEYPYSDLSRSATCPRRGLNREEGLINFPPLKRGGLLGRGGGLILEGG